ncbi:MULTISPECIES: glycosyltransferase family 1 protein [unclassified Pseudomonas]|jgi:glycosyltransferase involved in cell wall biosynthesis|uniref:glycosyltransferase family 4 protein n=1 Tax=unclassified Pseudomonas TaxID=196821 RepID=UPI00073057D7|nr:MULTISPECIES: glycosyltransferase family 1 protein [unclassified Pseudomonas]KSW26832.1 alpha-mannosyltransferase [Pseudomonas sp. ADP]OBP07993.1 alpha-mannosyltransferase [Pseudomonas sp. EGD-AKN5]QOF83486.1 glycosyltransferase family 1 protein [Pseudomonas sp. ADPe]
MRLLIVSDAWAPQVNGVVTSLRALVAELEAMGHQVRLLSPAEFRSRPCPSYPEIPLAWDLWKVGPAIEAFAPDCVHLATEGPLGWAARRWLLRRGLAFTTAIHTRFPEYLNNRWAWLPLAFGYAVLRRFHAPSAAVLVSSERMRGAFADWGVQALELWRKGVDTTQFQMGPGPVEGPVFLYVGRLAPEKNLEAFLDLDLPGLKRVVGDGPSRGELQARYPQVEFLGNRHGEALAEAYRAANVLVFPSRTDTLGLVMYEALACGTPVAAFPVPGPLDVLEEGVTGAIDSDLRKACLRALALDRQACAEWAAGQSWRLSAQQFLALQRPLGEPGGMTEAEALVD